MIKEDRSKRSFCKKAAAAAGFLAAAGYTMKLISSSADSARETRNKYMDDIKLQEAIMLRQQMVLMTDHEKEQMLDEILDSHSRNRA